MALTREEHFFDQKFVNMLKWATRALTKYGVANNTLDKKINFYIASNEERQKISTNRTAHYMMAQNENLQAILKATLELYDCSNPEREHKAEIFVDILQRTRDQFNAFVDKVIENRHMLPDDMKTLGAYASIFFGDFLEQPNERK